MLTQNQIISDSIKRELLREQVWKEWLAQKKYSDLPDGYSLLEGEMKIEFDRVVKERI